MSWPMIILDARIDNRPDRAVATLPVIVWHLSEKGMTAAAFLHPSDCSPPDGWWLQQGYGAWYGKKQIFLSDGEAHRVL